MKSYTEKEKDKIKQKYIELEQTNFSKKSFQDLTLKELKEIKSMRPESFNIIELREIVIKISKKYNLPLGDAFTAFKKVKNCLLL